MCSEYQILRESVSSLPVSIAVWDRILPGIHLTTMFFALLGRVERQIFYPENLILLDGPS